MKWKSEGLGCQEMAHAALTPAFCSHVTAKKIKPVCRYEFHTFACVNEDCSLLEGEEGGGRDPIKPSVMTVCFFFFFSCTAFKKRATLLQVE